MHPLTLRLASVSFALVSFVSGCATSKPRLTPTSPVKQQVQKLPLKEQYGVPTYLKFTNGNWTAHETGDITQPDTERIKLFPRVGWLADPDFPAGGLNAACKSGSQVRPPNPEGYSRCNSRLFVEKDGERVLDRTLLETVVAQTAAVDIARKSEPLWRYRHWYGTLTYRLPGDQVLLKYQEFIDTYANNDPDGLVIKAREHQERHRRLAEEQAAWTDKLRVQKAQMKAEKQSYQNNLRIGDSVRVRTEAYDTAFRMNPSLAESNHTLRGIIVDVRGPLIYVQWSNREPRMEWIQRSAVAYP